MVQSLKFLAGGTLKNFCYFPTDGSFVWVMATGMQDNVMFQLMLRLAVACVIAFALDNIIPRGSFLLGMVPLLPLVFFISLSFETACVAMFIGGLLADSMHLPIPFGFSAIGGVAMLSLLKIFYVYFNRDIKRCWIALIVIYTTCYHALLSFLLPHSHLLLFGMTTIGSIIYNYLLWVAVFHKKESLR
ncbi:MAG: hypothetical protein LBF26_03685 [Puniceicoccales bacterium]|jgi:hypothetical protein|nr:hypothetical protein [Puniceicoccales bacterium]